MSSRLPTGIAAPVENILVDGLGFTMRAWELIVLTLALQIGMLPLMARDFHRITLVSPFVNLAAVPLTGVIVPLGFVTLASALLFPALGGILFGSACWHHAGAFALGAFVCAFAQMELSNSWAAPLACDRIFHIRVVAGRRELLIDGKEKPCRDQVLGLLACSLVIARFPFPLAWSAGKLELSVLDVGQGDSLLVVSSGGKTLLIDGGGAFAGFGGQSSRGIDPGEEAVSPYLWSR